MKDLFDTITEARDRLDAVLEAVNGRQQAIDNELLLANCLAILKDIPTTNLSHDKRLRLQAMRKQLSDALAKRAA